MDTYADVIDYIRSRIGSGKEFKDNAAFAEHCGVSPVLVHRHLKGKRGKGLGPFFQLIAGAGLEIRPVSEASSIDDITWYIAESASLKLKAEELKGQVKDLLAENMELSSEIRKVEREAKEAYKKMLEVIEARAGAGQTSDRDELKTREPFKVCLQKGRQGFLQEK